MSDKRYSLGKGIVKSLKAVVLFAVPVIINAFTLQYPEYASLTVGGLLVLIWNFLKVKDIPLFKSI